MGKAESVQRTQDDELRSNEKKWGKTLWRSGWTAVPSVILEGQKALGLSPLDLVILLQLLKHWWTPGNLPHPGKRAIASCIGVEPQTVQRRLKAMERAGLITITARKSKASGDLTNSYGFAGLIKKATELAEVKLERVEEYRQKKNARLRRKGAVHLRAVE